MADSVKSPRTNQSGHLDNIATGKADGVDEKGSKTANEWRFVPQVATLWVHDDGFSKEEVLINGDVFGPLLDDDQLLEITALKAPLESRDFQEVQHDTQESHLLKKSANRYSTNSQASGTSSTGFDTERSTRYVCRPTLAPADIIAKHPTLQVSVTGLAASVFGFRNRSQVVVAVAEVNVNTASHVELVFRDAYFSRSDMWRLANTELVGRTVYVGQRIQFLGSLRATIKTINIATRKVSTGLFSGSTIPVFRSEAARYVLFIQMSREMWDFDSEGNGEILFNRVINGFLPDLFNRWSELEVKHLVTIVMFGRLVYSQADIENAVGGTKAFGRSGSNLGASQMHHKDFYRVVVTDMSSAQWPTILDELKKDFRVFLRDVCLEPVHPSDQVVGSRGEYSRPRIAGRPTTALKGNMLEAINIAASHFARDYVDRDLVRTGISVVVITAGSGVFEVDRDLLNLTSENLTNNGIGIDIVCLSRMPLHSTPLFKYRPTDGAAHANIKSTVLSTGTPTTQVHPLSQSLDEPLGNVVSSSLLSSASRTLSHYAESVGSDYISGWCYGIPQWVDLSYWAPDSHNTASSHRKLDVQVDGQYKARNKRFVPRVRMYELQMMGLMELGLADISIPYLRTAKRRDHIRTRDFSVRLVEGGKSARRMLPTVPTKTPKRGLKSSEGSIGTTGLLQDAKRQGHIVDQMGEYDRSLFLDAEKRNFQKSSTSPVSRDTTLKDFDESSRTSDEKTQKMVKEVPGASSGMKQTKQVIAPGGPGGVKQAPVGTSKASRTVSLAFKDFAPAPRAAAARAEVNVESARAHPSKTRPGHLERALTTSTVSLASVPQSGTVLTDESSDDLGADHAASLHEGASQPIAINAMVKSTRQGSGGVSFHSQDRKSIREENRLPFQEDQVRTRSNSSTSEGESDSSDGPTVSNSVPKTLLPFIRNINASNPIKRDPNAASLYGRWQHLYPRKPRAATVKWKSLCTPASVPLTTADSPSLDDLETQYESTTYTVTQVISNELHEVPQSRESLLQEMLSMRLSHGYQLVVGTTLTSSHDCRPCNSPTFFRPSKLTEDSNTLFLAMGHTIQRLSYSSDASVVVTRYSRKRGLERSHPKSIQYLPYMRTILSREYLLRPMELSGFSGEYPWELADNYLAGSKKDLHDAVQELRFWRARFVLIPVDPPVSAQKSMSDESDEEIHLRGITALTQLWQKHRFIPPKDRNFRPTARRRRDPNPLEIKFETLNPSEVVSTELDKLQTSSEDPTELPSTQLLPESELLERETSNLTKIAHAMQGDKGIEFKNRRWHFRLHYNCFRGEDFINWIMSNFRDIETRDEAVEFGNELMEHNLFQHVNSKHRFKDGHFFYSLAPEFRVSRTDPNKPWFPASKRSDRSVPPTPVAENGPKDPPLVMRSGSGSNVDEERSEKGPTSFVKSSSERKGVSISLSKMIRFDVDTRKRSNRREVINLHYDRLHNPENCYHLELSWLNVTSKLVDDAIAAWATQSEKYGLKLVEVPIAEASNITSYEPFRAVHRISLATPPPAKPTPDSALFTATSFGPQSATITNTNHHSYQKALLKRFNFVLDLEAKSEFPEDVEILYSWGKLEYSYTQYVHRSGVILAQITDDGDILLLANRLYNTRYVASKEAASKTVDSNTKKDDRVPPHIPPHPPASGILGLNAHNNVSSPAPTPLLHAQMAESRLSTVPELRKLQGPSHHRPASDASAVATPTFVTPESIKDELEAFCFSPEKLDAFYREVTAAALPTLATTKHSSTSSSILSPFRGPPGFEADIPEIYLPERLVGAGAGAGGRKQSIQHSPLITGATAATLGAREGSGSERSGNVLSGLAGLGSPVTTGLSVSGGNSAFGGSARKVSPTTPQVRPVQSVVATVTTNSDAVAGEKGLDSPLRTAAR